MSHVVTKTCPGCGAQPRIVVGFTGFCDADGCNTLCWDMTQTSERLASGRKIINLDELIARSSGSAPPAE